MQFYWGSALLWRVLHTRRFGWELESELDLVTSRGLRHARTVITIMPPMLARLMGTMGLTTLSAAPLLARVLGSTATTADADFMDAGRLFMVAADMGMAVDTAESARCGAVVNSTVVR